MPRILIVVTLSAIAADLAFAQRANAQEVVTQNVPARTVTLAIGGERIAYVRGADGGVTCTSQAESTVPVSPEPLATVECAQSRLRTVGQVRDAVDGGALDARSLSR